MSEYEQAMLFLAIAQTQYLRAIAEAEARDFRGGPTGRELESRVHGIANRLDHRLSGLPKVYPLLRESAPEWRTSPMRY